MAKKKRYPERHRSHEIGNRADGQFTDLMEGRWLTNPLKVNDYGRDYDVEEIVGGSPSGKIFSVQLKGVGKTPTFDSSGEATFPLEGRHLRYFSERVEEPVFLVVLDVTSRVGWFTFVQGHFGTPAAVRQLVKAGSMRLTLKKDHTIDNYPSFSTTVRRAFEFMREKYPGSIDAAMRTKIGKPHPDDPNFKIVGAEATAAGTTLRIQPRKDFTFSMTVTDPKSPAVERLAGLFEFGCALEVTSDEVDFTDFALVTNSQAKGGTARLSITPLGVPNLELTLSAEGSNPFTLSIAAVGTSGTKGALVCAAVKNAPLGIELKLIVEDGQVTSLSSINFSWDTSKWSGQDVSLLAWFDSIRTFWQNLTAKSPVTATLSTQGNRIGRGTFCPEHSVDFGASILHLCDHLAMVRALAKKHKKRLILPKPKDLLRMPWIVVEMAYQLQVAERDERDWPTLHIEYPGDAESPDFRDNPPGKEARRARVESVHPEFGVSIFGERIELGSVRQILDPVECRFLRKKGRKAFFDVRGVKETRVITECVEIASEVGSPHETEIKAR